MFSLIFIIFITINSPVDSLEYTIKSGETIGGILNKSGLGPSAVTNITSILKKEARFCYPREKIIIKKRDKRLIELKYLSKNGTFILDSLYNLSKEEIKEAFTIIKGEINGGCLYDAVIACGGTPNLIYRFADDIFPWDIDFNTETSKGDSFIIFTKKRFSGGRFLGYGDILFAQYKTRRKTYIGIHYKKDYYSIDGKSLQKVFLRAPLAYRRISSRFSRSRLHPILKIRRPHWGVDYAAPIGTPVRSVGDGVVTRMGWSRDGGRYIEIRHHNGYTTFYCHLSRYAKGMRRGRYVKQGRVIAYVGNTGLSTGPHLYFRIKKHGKPINPLRLNPPSKKPLTKSELKDYKEYKKKLFSLMLGVETAENVKELLDVRDYFESEINR
jgi:murein DD-endopeptidase MepM/ murein hydrolase activator NlpD